MREMSPDHHGVGEELGRGRHRAVGADPKNVANARRLRKAMSLPEVLLWRELRSNRLRVKFRRQFPVLEYVADFACVEVRLLIEIDGISHDMGARPAKDVARDAWLVEQGWRVHRISAASVLNDVGAVAAAVVALAVSLRPLHRPAGGPPPRSGEDLP